jgi:hypothetical protein
MTSLLDIAPVSVTVNVRGTDLEVKGISAKDVVNLLKRFPEIRKLLVNRTVTPEALIEFVPDAISAIIAAGTGAGGDKQVEERAATLAVAEQAKILGHVLKLTFPEGLGPFVEQMRALGVVADASGKAPATKLRGSSPS